MTDQQKQQMIDKIRKLLALSKSPNEHEAASAAEKAQALLAEYNLTAMDLEMKAGSRTEKLVIDGSIVTESVPWRRRVAAAVARLYFCDYFFTFKYEFVPTRPNGYVRKDAQNFVGAEHNVAIAKSIFIYLCDTVERLAREGSRNAPNKSKYQTSFRHACAGRLAIRIWHRIEAAKRGEIKAESGSNLPALLNAYEVTAKQNRAKIEAEVGKLKAVKARTTISDTKGYQDGLAAGDKIGLDGQVGTHGSKQIGGARKQIGRS